jgi:DNA-binding NtrC family response regulator
MKEWQKGGRLLIVDDEMHVRESLSSWFIEDGYEVETAKDANEALNLLSKKPFDIVITDIKMPGMDGVELQRRIKDVSPSVAVVLITAYASVQTAVQALKEGAYDYITKPFDPEQLSRVVEKALSQKKLKDENVVLKERISQAVPQLVVGKSPQMQKVFELVEAVAPTDTTVLINGESGTGKELIARLIHAKSDRCFGPLIAVNCGALPEGVLESELFGHEKGSFTGAVGRRKGKLELADLGTLFLDEIGEIPLKVQVELLRAIEEKKIVRVGGSEEIKVDFRVVCATNKDLMQLVKQGVFREDLYYRINVFVIKIPPLRERKEDILILAESFLEKLRENMGRKVSGFSDEAKAILLNYDWPGNVRELYNAVERALVLCKEGEVKPEYLPIRIGKENEVPSTAEIFSLDEMEKKHIENVLKICNHNITKASKLLNIDRVTLYNKIKKYNLSKGNDED